jgi:hypothetical protein
MAQIKKGCKLAKGVKQTDVIQGLRIHHGNEELGVHIFPVLSYDSLSLTCYLFGHHGLTSVPHKVKQQHRYTLHIAVTLFWSSSNCKRLQAVSWPFPISAVTCLFNYCRWSLAPVLYLHMHVYKYDLQTVSQNSLNMGHVFFHRFHVFHTTLGSVSTGSLRINETVFL